MQTFIKGHALIIGVGADLQCTVKDAEGLAEILTDTSRCAYPSEQLHLLTEQNANRAGILTALDDLAKTTDDESTFVFYFSGHGCKNDKSNYLMANGYDSNNLKETAISGSEFTDKIMAIPAKRKLIILDCCHAGGIGEIKDLPLVKSPLPDEALELFSKGKGYALIASSKEDEVSYTGKPYSVFTGILIGALCGEGTAKKDGYVWVTDLFGHTRERVPVLTSGEQHPVFHYKDSDDFIISFYAAGDSKPKKVPFALERETSNDDSSRVVINQTIGDNPKKTYQAGRDINYNITNTTSTVPHAIKEILFWIFVIFMILVIIAFGVSLTPILFKEPPIKEPIIINPIDSGFPKKNSEQIPSTEFRDCVDCPLMISIPQGSVTVGSDSNQLGRDNDEEPRKRINIKSFSVSKYEITFEQWDKCFDDRECSFKPQDHGWGRNNMPVVGISWNDAMKYVKWLSKITSKKYRLLSESEWEYAAKAGRIDSYKHDICEYAVVNKCANKYNHPVLVGSLKSNDFGIHDMLGNVWEWVADCYSPNHINTPINGSHLKIFPCFARQLKGGSWASHINSVRIANRYKFGINPSNREHSDVGFRIARDFSK